jgi:ribosomal-protein-alanine N-acetyltransferase
VARTSLEIVLRTERVLLRAWRDDDLEPFAALNADPEVMRYFPSTLTREQSDAMATMIHERLAENGWGLWAAEVDGAFIGFVGLNRPRFTAHFTPCVELGWRLARHAQGHGYATEAAIAARDFALQHLRGEPLVSFTVPENRASRRVMEKLGLLYEGDFEHPGLPEGHALRKHVLYRHPQSTKKSGVGSTFGST